MSQIFFFCTFYDGNATFVFKCKADLELCCQRGCCSIVTHNEATESFSSEWYFWLGLALFASVILVIGIYLSFKCLILIFLTMKCNTCLKSLPKNTKNRPKTQTNDATLSGVQHAWVADVALVATGATCYSPVQSTIKNVDHEPSDRQVTALPPHPLQQQSQSSRVSQRVAVADVI